MGRPPRHKGEHLSRNRTFRVRDGLDEKLREAAAEAGRSVSEQIEWMLQTAFLMREQTGNGRARIMDSNLPLSEQYDILGIEWADADKAANLLEDCKSAVLAERILGMGEMAHNKAEAQVKASAYWKDYIIQTVEARHKANLLKVRMEALRMRYGEEQSNNANERVQARL